MIITVKLKSGKDSQLFSVERRLTMEKQPRKKREYFEMIRELKENIS